MLLKGIQLKYQFFICTSCISIQTTIIFNISSSNKQVIFLSFKSNFSISNLLIRVSISGLLEFELAQNVLIFRSYLIDIPSECIILIKSIFVLFLLLFGFTLSLFELKLFILQLVRLYLNNSCSFFNLRGNLKHIRIQNFQSVGLVTSLNRYTITNFFQTSNFSPHFCSLSFYSLSFLLNIT